MIRGMNILSVTNQLSFIHAESEVLTEETTSLSNPEAQSRASGLLWVALKVGTWTLILGVRSAVTGWFTSSLPGLILIICVQLCSSLLFLLHGSDPFLK